MIRQTKAFEKFLPDLEAYITSSEELAGDSGTIDDVRDRLVALGRAFLIHSGYAERLSVDQRSFGLRILEAFSLFDGVVGHVVPPRQKDQTLVQRKAERGVWEKFVSRFSPPETNVGKVVVTFDWRSNVPIDKLVAWLAALDALMAEMPVDESAGQSPDVKTSPLLTERNCLFFQSLLGALHRSVALDPELAREERQVVNLLREERIDVEWPDSDIRQSTPLFRIVVDPSATDTLDALPCLRWRDGWLAGERIVPKAQMR